MAEVRRSHSLAVVVPAYNEGAQVERCVREVSEALQSYAGLSRLIVVDDGSSDETGLALGELTEENGLLTVIHHDGNRGYGAALRTGAQRALDLGIEWVLFMDSDLTNPPADVLRFGAVLDDSLDYIKASRYHPEGIVVGVPWRRRVVSVVGNRVARALAGLGVRDLTNGFRAVRTEPFLQMPLQERGFPIILEELYWARRMGLRLAEIPTTLLNRNDDQRASTFRYDRATLWAYSRYPLMMAAERAFAKMPFRAQIPHRDGGQS